MVLPVPAFTVLSGGKHASNTFAIQVFNIKFAINISVLSLSHIFCHLLVLLLKVL